MKFALLIEYDGSGFSGWQVQPNMRTVQGELESALARLCGSSQTVFGAGRTDAGVHASGMVAHVDLAERDELPVWKMLEALNALTADDVVIRDIRPVTDDFHARYTAVERSYEYRISRRRLALGRMYAWHVWNALDLELMQTCIVHLLGKHDFTSFSKLSDDVGHYRCTITEAKMTIEEESLKISLSANRFVRGMVRAVVGGLVEVGKGRLGPDEFLTLIDAPQELHRAKFICPPQGLTFFAARYPEQFGLW
jgi:tRNA pseudouridine38-40 synthase